MKILPPNDEKNAKEEIWPMVQNRKRQIEYKYWEDPMIQSCIGKDALISPLGQVNMDGAD